jgi:tetratricopeptide (TPR) repeat protein
MVLIGLVLGFPAKASASECAEWTARIVSIEGRVEALRAGEADWQEVTLNDTFCPEDRVRTREKSRAAFQLRSETLLRLDQNSMVKFSSPKPENPSLLELIVGKGFFMTRFSSPLTIETPYVNAGSGGTEYVIEVDEKNKTTTVTVIEGSMNLTNAAGSRLIEAGQSVVTQAGQAPGAPLSVRTRDTIQWALYYPPVLSPGELGLSGVESFPESDWRSKVQRSIGAYREGDLGKAFSTIEGKTEEISDPRFFAYRASLLLSVGRVNEARSDLEKALTLSHGNGLAMAMESIIAVVQNDKEKALQLAREASQVEPNSVSVKIALSYADQANFNLNEALSAVKEATRLDPQASLAWARTAELLMGQGELDEALEAAKRAEAINPREARIQTVLGFAYLTQIKIPEAKGAFEKGITLNSADPMPRLGLGLAKIREGKLAEGRKEIEIAATLDPGNALIRSYLGKAYYEEKRDPQAEIQFGLAKGLDPNDPTPYLYDAIRKQTLNRPVEAIKDLEESIKLNDNRAVYRSRLLLDNDLSSRSVSQGRIAEDLGFGQLALSEGWKSVNTDPTNYSAHRFLADSYGSLPNSEIARQSALGLSQVLQPLNSNPVQPGLGNRTAFTPGTSPADLSFNEFTRLFNRNQVHLLASGIVGNEKTRGEEIVATALFDRYSLSIGQFHNETDGYRINADISETIYNVFAQVALTPKASVLAEYRYDLTKNGDIDLRWDPENFTPDLRKKLEKKTFRFGFHYALTEQSHFILSALYQDAPEDTEIPSFFVDLHDHPNGYTGEAQYLFRSPALDLILGGGHFDGEIKEEGTVFGFPIDETTNFQHTNFYIYSNLHLPSKITLTVGGSGDLYDGPPRNRNQFNPKFGLIWELTSSTTLRMAAFRVLQRDLVSNQTIEPTQVAGFQQFFVDGNGTDSKRYGIAVDQKFSLNLFGGLEISKRDVNVPAIAFTPGAPTEIDFEERTGRAYLYWTPFNWAAATAEYYYERLSDTPADPGIIQPPPAQSSTHRVPLGINLFLPWGFFTKWKATYIDQNGYFRDLSVIDPLTGPCKCPRGDHFWLADAVVGYRLPKRFGIFTVEAKNLFDKKFRFQNPAIIPGTYPFIQPERVIYAKLTLSY